MRAKFIGKDRSMGFRNGKIYQIITDVNINSKGKAFLWLYDKDSRLNCPYKNLEALLANWKIMDN